MKVFSVDFYDVIVDYPKIHLMRPDQKTKVICETKENFEKTFQMCFNVFKLDLETCLEYAAQIGSLNLAKYFIQQNVGNSSSYRNTFAFRWAVDSGHIAIVKLLVEDGVFVNIDEGYALRHAVFNEDIELVEYLLSVDANKTYLSKERLKTVSDEMKKCLGIETC